MSSSNMFREDSNKSNTAFDNNNDDDDDDEYEEYELPHSSLQFVCCSYLKDGFCLDGDECPYQHSTDLVVPCQFGDSCLLKHYKRKWVPCDKADKCGSCGKMFRLFGKINILPFRRKHHCRYCAAVICLECLQRDYQPYPVCTKCEANIDLMISRDRLEEERKAVEAERQKQMIKSRWQRVSSGVHFQIAEQAMKQQQQQQQKQQQAEKEPKKVVNSFLSRVTELGRKEKEEQQDKKDQEEKAKSSDDKTSTSTSPQKPKPKKIVVIVKKKKKAGEKQEEDNNNTTNNNTTKTKTTRVPKNNGGSGRIISTKKRVCADYSSDDEMFGENSDLSSSDEEYDPEVAERNKMNIDHGLEDLLLDDDYNNNNNKRQRTTAKSKPPRKPGLKVRFEDEVEQEREDEENFEMLFRSGPHGPRIHEQRKMMMMMKKKNSLTTSEEHEENNDDDNNSIQHDDEFDRLFREPSSHQQQIGVSSNSFSPAPFVSKRQNNNNSNNNNVPFFFGVNDEHEFDFIREEKKKKTEEMNEFFNGRNDDDGNNSDDEFLFRSGGGSPTMNNNVSNTSLLLVDDDDDNDSIEMMNRNTTSTSISINIPQENNNSPTVKKVFPKEIYEKSSPVAAESTTKKKKKKSSSSKEESSKKENVQQKQEQREEDKNNNKKENNETENTTSAKATAKKTDDDEQQRQDPSPPTPLLRRRNSSTFGSLARSMSLKQSAENLNKEASFSNNLSFSDWDKSDDELIRTASQRRRANSQQKKQLREERERQIQQEEQDDWLRNCLCCCSFCVGTKVGRKFAILGKVWKRFGVEIVMVLSLVGIILVSGYYLLQLALTEFQYNRECVRCFVDLDDDGNRINSNNSTSSSFIAFNFTSRLCVTPEELTVEQLDNLYKDTDNDLITDQSFCGVPECRKKETLYGYRPIPYSITLVGSVAGIFSTATVNLFKKAVLIPMKIKFCGHVDPIRLLSKEARSIAFRFFVFGSTDAYWYLGLYFMTMANLGMKMYAVFYLDKRYEEENWFVRYESIYALWLNSGTVQVCAIFYIQILPGICGSSFITNAKISKAERQTLGDGGKSLLAKMQVPLASLFGERQALKMHVLWVPLPLLPIVITHLLPSFFIFFPIPFTMLAIWFLSGYLFDRKFSKKRFTKKWQVFFLMSFRILSNVTMMVLFQTLIGYSTIMYQTVDNQPLRLFSEGIPWTQVISDEFNRRDTKCYFNHLSNSIQAANLGFASMILS